MGWTNSEKETPKTNTLAHEDTLQKVGGGEVSLPGEKQGAAVDSAVLLWLLILKENSYRAMTDDIATLSVMEGSRWRSGVSITGRVER